MSIGYIYIFESIKGKRVGHKYIGQTFNDAQIRCDNHLLILKKKKHHSPKLQRYFNKYGSDSLKFSILMRCPKEELNFWEKFWIKSFDSNKNGFNCTGGGDNPPINYRKCILKNIITGEIEISNSINEFSRKYNLPITSISAVLRGIENRVGDWYAPNNKWVPRFYILISPENKEYRIPYYRIKDFCKEYKLKHSYIHSMLRGEKEVSQGWKRPNSKVTKSKGIIKEFNIINPNGEVIFGNNISEFCRNNKLCPSNICKVINGKRKQHKGWKSLTV